MTDLSATDSKIARYTRFHGLFKKEILQILRDPSSWIIALVLPVFLLFLFGYGVSLDASHVRLGVLVESPTPETREFTSALEFSGFFRLHPAHSRAPLEADLVSGQLDGMVILAQDFNARLLRGETAPIQLITDGSDPNTAGLVAGYVQGVWQTWLQQRASQQGVELSMPIRLEPRVWFNPEAKSRHFLVPGVIALIQMLIGTLLTALVVAREWERGTIEALLATPVTTAEMLLAKLLPNFLLGMAAMVISVLLAVFLFEVPLRGSLWALSLVTAAFLACALSVGLLASTLSRSQFVATQVAMLASFLPGFFLSGFLFELSGTPAPIRAISHIVPARYYVQSLQTIFLAGDIPSLLIPDTLALLGLAGLLMLLVLRNTRHRLD